MCTGVETALVATAVGSSVANSVSAPSGNEATNAQFGWTSPGASTLWRPYLNQLMTLMKGGETPQMELLKNYYNQAEGNLTGSLNRLLAQSQASGAAQGAQMSLSNPNAYANYMRERTAGQVAPAMGEFQAQKAQGLYGANADQMRMWAQLMPQLSQLGAR